MLALVRRLLVVVGIGGAVLGFIAERPWVGLLLAVFTFALILHLCMELLVRND